MKNILVILIIVFVSCQNKSNVKMSENLTEKEELNIDYEKSDIINFVDLISKDILDSNQCDSLKLILWDCLKKPEIFDEIHTDFSLKTLGSNGYTKTPFSDEWTALDKNVEHWIKFSLTFIPSEMNCSGYADDATGVFGTFSRFPNQHFYNRINSLSETNYESVEECVDMINKNLSTINKQLVIIDEYYLYLISKNDHEKFASLCNKFGLNLKTTHNTVYSK